MFHKFASLIAFVLFALLVPCLAQAQDAATPSLEEKFGGFHLSVGDSMGWGIGRHGEDSRKDAFLDGYHSPSAETNILHLWMGYLFGVNDRIFIGPELTVSSTVPFFVGSWINTDIRFHLLVPVTNGFAVELAVGLGWWSGIDNDPVDYIYLPVEFGANYTFDNGFMIGLSLQVFTGFTNDKKLVETGELLAGKPTYENVDNGVIPYAGLVGIGLRLGYRFGNYE